MVDVPDRIPVQDVVATQFLRCQVNGEIPPPLAVPPTLETVTMDIYTGWILLAAGNSSGGVFRNDFISFVPLGTKTGDRFDVQGYPEGTTAIVSASIASFASTDTPSTCAIDSATVDTRDVPDFSARVLVLKANYAIQHGWLNRVAYQVTVFAPPARHGTFNKVSLRPGALLPLSKAEGEG
jgi:hypothetical protein